MLKMMIIVLFTSLVSRVLTGKSPEDRDKAKQFVEAAKATEQAELDRLFADTHSMIWKYARQLANGDEDTATDFVHMAYENASKNLARFQGNSQISTWFCGCVFNACRDYRKKNLRQNQRTISLNDLVSTTTDRTIEEVTAVLDDTKYQGGIDPAFDSSVEAKVAHGLEMESIRKAINSSLSPDEWKILLMKEIEGFRQDEIAHALGIPVGTVKSRLSRALKKLREALSPKPGELK